MKTKKERYAKEPDPIVDSWDSTGSPAVTRVERFLCDGVEYATFEKALSAREDKIEEFVRPMLNSLSPLPPRDQIALVEWIITNRADLRKLLDY